MKLAITHLLLILALSARGHAQELLTFRMVHKLNDELQAQAETGRLERPVAYDVFTNVTASATNLYWVKKRWEFTDKHIADIAIHPGDEKKVTVEFIFTPKGTKMLGHTGNWSEGRHMAIMTGGALLAVVPIGEPIYTGRLKVEGVFARAEAHELQQSLMRSKAEPAPRPVPSRAAADGGP